MQCISRERLDRIDAQHAVGLTERACDGVDERVRVDAHACQLPPVHGENSFLEAEPHAIQMRRVQLCVELVEHRANLHAPRLDVLARRAHLGDRRYTVV